MLSVSVAVLVYVHCLFFRVFYYYLIVLSFLYGQLSCTLHFICFVDNCLVYSIQRALDYTEKAFFNNFMLTLN